MQDIARKYGRKDDRDIEVLRNIFEDDEAVIQLAPAEDLKIAKVFDPNLKNDWTMPRQMNPNTISAYQDSHYLNSNHGKHFTPAPGMDKWGWTAGCSPSTLLGLGAAMAVGGYFMFSPTIRIASKRIVRVDPFSNKRALAISAYASLCSVSLFTLNQPNHVRFKTKYGFSDRVLFQNSIKESGS